MSPVGCLMQTSRAQNDPTHDKFAAYNTLSCGEGGKIVCLLFASYGRVGGACNGDEFKEDPSNQWVHLPTSFADKMVGQHSYEITSVTTTETTGSINGEVVSGFTPVWEETKLKVLALCDQAVMEGEPSDARARMSSVLMLASVCVSLFCLLF
eukprot:GDKI01030853.1.p1 GENE.GDKI01030853.1~~GDKI01030853.1.p1  ORF type:complete len:153 (-),score=50.08 GDKI01030853.1:135-593(-)